VLAWAITKFAGNGLDTNDNQEGTPGTGNDGGADAGDVENNASGDVASRDAGDAPPGADAGTDVELAPPRPVVAPPTTTGHPLTAAEIQAFQDRIRRETEATLKQTNKALDQVRRNVPRETEAGQIRGASRSYLINSRPFALIYVDGEKEPINRDGKTATRALKSGSHKFRAINKDLVPPIDMTFTYDVHMNDFNNTIILNLETRTVVARNNPALPF
jgi:hypothetical protein